MAKFYQHMEPGESLGRVTRLKYIDDISDDELIIYMFTDGTKCDEHYIAEVNNLKAFNGQYVMAELTGPTNQWKFEVKEFDHTKTKKVTSQNGEEWELPDPCISKNGDYLSISSVTEEGAPIYNTKPMAGKKTTATPPVVVNKKVEPKENYLLSLHPELLTSPKKEDSVIDDISILSNSIKHHNKPVYENNEMNDTVLQYNNEPETNTKTNTNTKLNTKSNIELTNKNMAFESNNSILKTVKYADITLNLDALLNNKEASKIKVIYNNKEEEFDIKYFVNYIANINNNVVQSEQVENDEEDDQLIISMLNKSKKVPCNIGIDLELALPPKEIYNTIKNVFPDGMTTKFVNAISKRINTETLKKSLANGLNHYYNIENDENI